MTIFELIRKAKMFFEWMDENKIHEFKEYLNKVIKCSHCRCYLDIQDAKCIRTFDVLRLSEFGLKEDGLYGMRGKSFKKYCCRRCAPEYDEVEIFCGKNKYFKHVKAVENRIEVDEMGNEVRDVS